MLLCRTDFNADNVLAFRCMGFHHVPYALRIKSAWKQVVLDVVYQFGILLIPRLSCDVPDVVYPVTDGFCLTYHNYSSVSVVLVFGEFPESSSVKNGCQSTL